MASTAPHTARWTPGGTGSHRVFERTVVIARTDAAWQRASRDVLTWAVKTRSGFAVDSDERVKPGDRRTVTARICGLTIREPVEVVAVVDEPHRVGFSYRTLPGHPVDGEEAFIVHREAGVVRCTMRSLTAPAPSGPWRALHPLLRLAQRVVRPRYARALR